MSPEQAVGELNRSPVPARSWCKEVVSRVRRPVTGGLPWPSDQTRSLAVARDWRTLCIGARPAEADLWLVERRWP